MYKVCIDQLRRKEIGLHASKESSHSSIANKHMYDLGIHSKTPEQVLHGSAL